MIQIGREPDPAKRLKQAWGAAIRQVREMQGLTLDEVAEAMTQAGCRITPQAISAWERGETAPRWHHQFAVAKVLNTTHNQLFGIHEVA